MLKPIFYIERPDNRVIVADNFRRKKSYSVFMNSQLRPIQGETVVSDDDETFTITDIRWVPEEPVNENTDMCCLAVTLKKFE